MRSCCASDLKTAEGSNDPKSCKSKWKSFTGLFYILISVIASGFTSVIVKQFTYIDPAELSILRNTGSFVFSLPLTIYYTRDVWGSKEHRVLLTIRSFLASTAFYLNFLAFRYLPLSEAAILLSTMPALVSIIARIYIKELCGFIQICAVAITAAGALLSIRLPKLLEERRDVLFDSYYVTGLGCAIGSVTILSFSFVMIRKLKSVHPSVILLYSGLIGIFENAVVTGIISAYSLPRCGWDIVKMSLIGIFSFLQQYTLVLATKTEGAGIVSVIRSCLEIIIGIVFQVVFFGLVPDFYNIGGGILVMISVATLSIRMWLLSLPEDANARIKFKFLIY